MLQIISGKFFKTDDRHHHDGKGILFSNYSWIRPIKTSVATLESLDPYKSAVISHVVTYLNQIEKVAPPGKDVLIRTGDYEIVDQFQLLCTFGLKAFFHPDKTAVAVSCRAQRSSGADL